MVAGFAEGRELGIQKGYEIGAGGRAPATGPHGAGQQSSSTPSCSGAPMAPLPALLPLTCQFGGIRAAMLAGSPQLLERRGLGSVQST